MQERYEIGTELNDLPNFRMHRIFLESPDASEDFLQPLPALPNYEISKRMPPFYVIQPTGIQHLSFIKEEIEKSGIKIIGERSITQFETLARYIYPVKPEKKRSYFWLMAVRSFLPEQYQIGHVLFLDPSTPYEKVASEKKRVREMIGVVPFRIYVPGSEPQDVDVHHIHAPEDHEFAFQANVVTHFIK